MVADKGSAAARLFDQLEELPAAQFEQRGKLGYSDSAPFITVRLDRPKPPPRPESTAVIPDKSSHVTNYYRTRITYPYVMCFPTSDPAAVEALRLKQDDDGLRQGVRDLGMVARSKIYYKLTKLDGRELSPFYLCRVHYGPFFATVTESESCFLGVPKRWTLEALGGEVALVWDGEWADIPSLPNLTVTMNELFHYDSEYSCCPGFQWCNGGCKAIELGCSSVTPIT